jgi:hypothetical protein
MFTKLWKLYLASALLIVAFFSLFIRFVPWLFGSYPITVIDQFNLKNTPPPEGAQSFAINHGSAMYFNEPIPSEIPILTIAVVVAFIFVITALKLLDYKIKRLKNGT